MKRMLVVAAVATALGLVASDANANGWGAPPMPAAQQGMQAGPVAPQGDRYGYNPLLRQLLWWKKDRCGAGGCGGAAGAGGAGTMVYPINPYVRSPRDWFQN